MMESDGIRLDEIPGLGPVRRAALAEAGVHDLQGLLAMKMAELSEVRGIGAWQARKIWEFLRQHGLLVEDEEVDGSLTVHVAEPQTAAEAEAIAHAVEALDQQSAVEARVEAEVAVLAEALEDAAARENHAVPPAPRAAEATAAAPATGSEPEAPQEDEEEAEQPADEVRSEVRERLESQREELPAAALQLVEAIRQSAVTRQLTRQVTRLLIVAGEFSSGPVSLPEGRQRDAAKVLDRAHRLLERSVQKQAFTPAAQKDLALRLRKYRKSLEALLEQAREAAAEPQEPRDRRGHKR